MKTVILLCAALAAAAPLSAQSSHYVSGHTTRSGAYVAPHYQTSPNSTTSDNWSTRGNVNPYTGQAGTKPDTKPAWSPNAATSTKAKSPWNPR